MTNELSFNQAARILNDVQKQATGQAALAATNTAEFVTAATTTLKAGADPVLNALSQVLTRTIFSVRPYRRKFGIVEVSESAYGNHIRKLQIADKPLADDDRYKWPAAYDATQVDNPTGDGQSVDQQAISKPQALQTNFYGANVWSDNYTLFKDQLDNAFRGPAELGSFVAAVVQNITDKLESVRENTGRACVANFVGGIVDAADTTRVIKLLTEYNTLTGLKLTAQSVMQPDNYVPFVRWALSRIMTVSDMMTERTNLYQTVVNDMPIMHHTPKDRQKLMLLAGPRNMMVTNAIADTYHDDLLSLGGFEAVNFWQSVKTPDTINVTPGYIDSTGAAKTGAAVEQAGVFGVLFDEEALGYAATQQWATPAPFNARGGYTTTWLHETQRLWNDHTEKGVVFLLA